MNISILRIYVENSVIGGYFEIEFEEPTKRLFNLFKNGYYKAVISTHVTAELAKGAPQNVIDNLKTIDCETHTVSEEMVRLTKKYMEQKIVSKKYEDDALHIAIATVIGVDVLVSWNFKHIVNLDKIRKFNAVNLLQGYKTIEIRSPREVIENERWKNS
jgi:hypothetical protein